MPRDLSPSEAQKQVNALMGRLNRAAKGGQKRNVLTPIHMAENPYGLRRSTGIPLLDLQLAGGIPAGGLSYLSGPDGGGKTLLLFKMFQQLQRFYGNKARILYAVTEGAPDYTRMRDTGVMVTLPSGEIDRLNRLRVTLGMAPFSKKEEEDLRKQVGGFDVLREASGEKLLDALVDCVQSRCYDIIALDSVSALTPETELVKDLDEDPRQAAVAMALTRFFLHYLPETTGLTGLNETTVMFVSQVRSNKKKSEVASHMAKYMKDWSAQGAYAARHGKLDDICVWGGSKEKEEAEKVAVPTGQLALGGVLGGARADLEKIETAKAARSSQPVARNAVAKKLMWELLKGRHGAHDGLTGSADMTYRSPFIDTTHLLYEALYSRGLIKEVGGQISVLCSNGTPMDGMQGIESPDALVKLIEGNVDLDLLLRQHFFHASKVSLCEYR